MTLATTPQAIDYEPAPGATLRGEMFVRPRVLFEDLAALGLAEADVCDVVLPLAWRAVARLNLAIPVHDPGRRVAHAVAHCALEVLRRADGPREPTAAALTRELSHVPDAPPAVCLGWLSATTLTYGATVLEWVIEKAPERQGEHMRLAAGVLAAVVRTLEHYEVLMRRHRGQGAGQRGPAEGRPA